MKLVHVLLVALLAVGANAASVDANLKAKLAEANKAIKAIDVKQLNKMIKAEENFILLDIREPDEVTAGKIDHLEHKVIPAGLVPFMIKGIKDLNKKIVVHCKTGGRSAFATKMIQDLGYKNVYNLTGGIKAWIEAGYPIENLSGTFKLAK